MSEFSKNLRQVLKNTALRLLRIVGLLLLIYISMVFYLALTERRNAFPRAIYHKEANEAIQGKAKKLTCTLQDGIILNGFSIGREDDPVLLYYPEADEDAAQFLAQVEEIPGINIIAFNYRGSAQNKGTPSEENFESDGKSIAECAAQINGNIPLYIAGHGTGAILAVKQLIREQHLILIDPIFDIANSISQKYRLLYPKFLVRTSVKIDSETLKKISNSTTVLFDRKQDESRTNKEIEPIRDVHKIVRNGETLQKIFYALLQTTDTVNSLLP